MKQISTSGDKLSESQLRMFFRCSKLYDFGETVEFSPGTTICKSAVEELTVKALRKEVYDPLRDLQFAVVRAAGMSGQTQKLMDGQIDRIMNSSVIWMNEFFNLFPFSTYQPVYGPADIRVKVSKTPVTLNVSGFYRSRRNATMHVVTFSPYASDHSVKNDPINLLKLKVLEPYVAKHWSGRPNVKLHIFNFGKENNFNYFSLDSNFPKALSFKRIKAAVENIESSNFYPIVPCPHFCKYKSTCFGGE